MNECEGAGPAHRWSRYYLGCIRVPASRRTVSALKYELVIISTASEANSDEKPRRLGNSRLAASFSLNCSEASPVP